MSYEEIRCNEVRARKVYACEWCNEIIARGDQHISRAYKMEGEFTSGRMHLECFKAMESSDYGTMSDGWAFGSMQRGVPVK